MKLVARDVDSLDECNDVFGILCIVRAISWLFYLFIEKYTKLIKTKLEK